MSDDRLAETASVEPVRQRTFEIQDLCWIPVWSITKLAYLVVPVPLLFLVARIRGMLRSLVDYRRSWVHENLVSFFGTGVPDAEIRRIVRRYFIFAERSRLTALWPRIQGFARLEKCAVEGTAHLDAALAGGKGAILLTAHFGYARLAKYMLRRKGYAAWLAGPQPKAGERKRGSRTADFFYHSLLRMPAFSQSESNDLETGLNVRPLAAVLQRNEILILTADGLRATNLVPVKVAGHRLPMATGSVGLSRLTGAPILPAFVLDSGSGLIGIKMTLEQPLEAQAGDTERERMLAQLGEFGRVLERYIATYPHLYRWGKRHAFKKRLERMNMDVSERYERGSATGERVKAHRRHSWRRAQQ